MAFELVCGADFSCKLMYGAGSGDLGGSRGSDSAKISGRTPGSFKRTPGSPGWSEGALVLEGSLAFFFWRREIALEVACGADFSWKLMRGEGPGDLGGSRTPGSF